MIIRENIVDVEEYRLEEILNNKEVDCKPEESIYFDLEHYVYKKPKCIGVFGACVYNKKNKKINVTQYMIENKSEVVDILLLAKKYFIKMKREGKKVIVTFAGNNDFTVIKYLFNKYGIYFDFEKEFKSIDIQKEYEKDMKISIGLKNLEKIFEVYREGDVISGSNLAKTFHKVFKDKEYIQRMPKEKIETKQAKPKVSMANITSTEYWPKVVNNLKTKGKITLFTNLMNTKAVEINDMQLGIVGLTAFGKTVVEQPTNKLEIEKAIAQESGKTMQIKVEEPQNIVQKTSNLNFDIPINIIDE